MMTRSQACTGCSVSDAFSAWHFFVECFSLCLFAVYAPLYTKDPVNGYDDALASVIVGCFVSNALFSFFTR
jgi:hypothetical protein